MNDEKKQSQIKIPRALLANPLQSIEGRIFCCGMGGLIIYIILFGVLCLSSAKYAQLIGGMTASHILFGRAAGLSFGYAVELSSFMVIFINMFIETVIVLLFYPLFILSWQHLIEVPILKKVMNDIRQAADDNQKTIRRYGVIGLFVFVLFPFWMTGPIIGCVIGYFLGFSAVRTLAVVLGGTYAAIFLWAIFFKSLNQQVAAFSPYAPLILLSLIIIIVVILHKVARHRKR
ncbi:small multi-drug export protein [Candidatus Omnitrophota bacterium]